MIDIPKIYNPAEAERDHYARWEERGYFSPEINKDRNAPVFTIVIPPPNVTGSLHRGHALQHTMMDVLTRHKRMLGFRALWLPGMDHAGISTQLMVTRQIKKEGLTRHDLGREKFVERVWQWKQQYGGIILKQIRRIGSSCDWSRERFTMDEGLSRAVREVFVTLYEEGLIYQAEDLINWCPSCRTALSDLEVDVEEGATGRLWEIAYPLAEGEGRLVVATTRPETMLGDTAIAVHPDDPRYKELIGCEAVLPLMERRIPIIADAILVDPAFGTGVVKVTPAHDFNDFETGKRHKLPLISVMDEMGRINANGGA